jgi:uncharacterized protein with PIN domain
MSDEPIRFLADNMLGTLAKWLRILGYNTAYNPAWDDNDLARISRAEGRILLTRDVELSRRRGLRALLIESEVLEGQIAQVIREYGLSLANPFSRCPVCNTPLEPADRHDALGRVPSYVFCTKESFRYCPHCNQFYWRGTHWERMREKIEELTKAQDRRTDSRA